MRYLTLLFFVLITFIGNAQTTVWTYLPDSSVKVYAGGKAQTMPWCGGFNNPQFSSADLNHDGLADLVVFEPGLGVKTFINDGYPGYPRYVYAPEYALNFPPCMNFLIMKDYNGDGIADLFEGEYDGYTGFVAYKGYYNFANQLCFNFYQTLWFNNDNHLPGFWQSAYNPPSYMPSIVDVDGDGDLDFFGYEITGFWIYYYRNMAVERGLPKDSIVLELEDQCWGKARQGFARSFYLPANCDNSNLIIGDNSYYRTMHSGNTICLLDYDMDSDYDALNGNVYYNQLTLLTNGRVETHNFRDTMIAQDTTWQTGGTQVNLATWPAAYNIDVDVDGKKDILISPEKYGAENYNCVWYYNNHTVPGHTDWRFVSDSFLVDQSIDIGTAAYPAFFDYNKDGKPDLFVGSDGYYDSSNGQLKSRISYYKNTSTPGYPSLTLIAKNFLNLDSFNYEGAAPAFGDIDNDGKTDLILGHSDGTISWFKNMAASDTVTPIWQLAQDTLMYNSNIPIIANGGHAAPFIYDIDKDGKPDIVVGDHYGYLEYYRNVSSAAGVMSLQFVNRELGKVQADPGSPSGVNYSTPFIGKIDTTGIDYLLLGSYSGAIYRYTGFQSGDTTATYTMVDADYCHIDSTYLLYTHGESLIGIYQGMRSAPVVGSIPGDGSYDLLVGEERGGVEFYKYGKDTINSVPKVMEIKNITVFPNPANDVVYLKWENIAINADQLQLTVTNIEGQQVYATTILTSANAYSIPITDLPSGVYICTLQCGAEKYYGKIVVMPR